MRSVVLAAALASAATAVYAQGAPQTVAFVARLTDDSGSAITGQHDFVFALYDMATAGSNLWSETRTGVMVGSDGVLFLDLGSVAAMAGTPLDSNILNGSSRWLDITIDGVESSPRVLIESTPYSIRSGQATNSDALQGHAAAYFQRSVVNMCTGTQTIQAVNGDGSVTCVAAPVYTAGTGLALSVGNVFSVDPTMTQERVNGMCLTGAINAINADGSVTCSTPTTYTAGTGLTLTANQFAVDFTTVQHAIGACSAGSAITSVNVNGTPACIDVTYTAGNGLSLNASNQFSVDTATIEAKISPATSTVAASAATNSNSYVSLAGGPATAITVPASGTVLVTVTANIQPTTNGDVACMGFQAGAAAASDTQALCFDGGQLQASATYLLTGLTAGAMTFTAQYHTSGGKNANFANRSIIAVPVP